MIQMQSNLFVADNSGARKIQCIKVLGGSKRKSASIGDIIVVSIKDAIPRAKVKKGDVYKAVIVRTSKDFQRLDGTGRGHELVQRYEHALGPKERGVGVRAEPMDLISSGIG